MELTERFSVDDLWTYLSFLLFFPLLSCPLSNSIWTLPVSFFFLFFYFFSCSFTSLCVYACVVGAATLPWPFFRMNYLAICCCYRPPKLSIAFLYQLKNGSIILLKALCDTTTRDVSQKGNSFPTIEWDRGTATCGKPMAWKCLVDLTVIYQQSVSFNIWNGNETSIRGSWVFVFPMHPESGVTPDTGGLTTPRCRWWQYKRKCRRLWWISGRDLPILWPSDPLEIIHRSRHGVRCVPHSTVSTRHI